MRATCRTALACLCLLPASLVAGIPAAGVAGPLATEQWHPTALFGGSVFALAQAPSAPKVFYAATDVAGVFRSDDGGETWSARNQSLTGYELWIQLDGLAVAPSDPDLVYAISGDGLLRSRDGGKTWTLLAAAPALNRLSFRLSGSLLGAAGDGLYQSRDEGDSWTLLAFEGQWVSSALEDPRERHAFFATVWMGDSDCGGLWKSTDGGSSWQVKLEQIDLDQLTLDPSRHGSLYVLGDGSIDRSVDEGETWTLLPTDALGPVGIAASANGILYAAAYGGSMGHSLDGGETWLPVGSSGGYDVPPYDFIWDLVVDAAHPDTVLAGGGTEIWRSGDGGITWSTGSAGILASAPTSLAIGPDGSLFATTFGLLSRSDNGGRTWQKTAPGGGPFGAWIVLDPVRPEILYLPDVLLRSRDSGRTWQTMAPPGANGYLHPSGTGFAVDPRSPDILYLSGFNTFHTETDSFFFRSDDGGTTWQDLGAGIPNMLDAIAVAPSEPAVVYAIEDGVGLLRSGDGGQSWSLEGEGLPASADGENLLASLAVDPRLSSVVYVGGTASGVYRSTDGGRHFAALGAGLEAADVATIVVDPTDPSRVYAGIVGLGVFRWNQEANRWEALNDALPLNADPYQLFNGAIALAARSQILYAATLRGVYRLRLTDP
jgi:photosystem II stability/assembly factor-like uncharacterized protein